MDTFGMSEVEMRAAHEAERKMVASWRRTPLWTKANNLLALLRQLEVVAVVDDDYIVQYHNAAPGVLLTLAMTELQEVLDAEAKH